MGDLKIGKNKPIESKNGLVHWVAQQTTKRGFRTACGIYFRDTRKTLWKVPRAGTKVSCVNCMNTDVVRHVLAKKKMLRTKNSGVKYGA